MAEVLIEEPPESMWDAVEKAARFCPVKAIKLVSSNADASEHAAGGAQPGGDERTHPADPAQ